MSSIAEKAREVLSQHRRDPKTLALQLAAHSKGSDMTQDQASLTLMDEENTKWTFVVRRRCRLFLMAKHSAMKTFEDIDSSSAY